MNNRCESQCSEAQVTRICPEGMSYVKKVMQSSPKIAVMACEGGCIKGEVARVAASILAYQMHREDTVRICLGDAATGNSGFYDLIKQAPEVIAIEGCPLQCGTQILQRRIPELKTTVVDASQLYEYDKTRCFEIFDLPREQIEAYARIVAQFASSHHLSQNTSEPGETPCCSSCSCCG